MGIYTSNDYYFIKLYLQTTELLFFMYVQLIIYYSAYISYYFFLLVCFEDSDCAIIIICTLISFTGTTGFYYDFCLYFISILLPSNDYTTGICSKVCTFVSS